MANYTLYISSIMFGLIHVAAIFMWRPSKSIAGAWFIIILLAGVLTSIWNHGSTSHLAKWCDRVLMTCGIWTDIYFISVTPRAALQSDETHWLLQGACLALVLLCLVGYLAAKALIRWSNSSHWSDGGKDSVFTSIPVSSAPEVKSSVRELHEDLQLRPKSGGGFFTSSHHLHALSQSNHFNKLYTELHSNHLHNRDTELHSNHPHNLDMELHSDHLHNRARDMALHSNQPHNHDPGLHSNHLHNRKTHNQPHLHLRKCQISRNFPHLFAHWTITIMHCFLLYRYSVGAPVLG